MLWLGVSTSTDICSVALARDERLLAALDAPPGRRHAELLFGLLDELLATAGVERGELGAVACDVGPGSFTGVRVGVASCQGLAFALGIEAHGVRSLDAVLDAVLDAAVETPGDASRPIAAVLDGGRGEVFVAARDPLGAEVRSPEVRRVSELSEWLASLGRPRVVGSAALAPHAEGFAFAPSTPSGAKVLASARRAASRGRAPLAPVYVRAPEVTLPQR